MPTQPDDAKRDIPAPAAMGSLNLGEVPAERFRPMRLRRNRLCVWAITIGAANIVVYTLIYAFLGGDAHNGYRRFIRDDGGAAHAEYFVRGHHLQNLNGRETRVTRGVWIYSYVHSMALLLTSGAMVLSMLVLARPHIIVTMRDGWLDGATFVNAFGAVVVALTLLVVVALAWDFLTQLAASPA